MASVWVSVFFYLFVLPKYKRELNIAVKELKNIEIKLEEEKQRNQDLQDKLDAAIKELEDLLKESQGKTLEKLKKILNKFYELRKPAEDVAKIVTVLISIVRKIAPFLYSLNYKTINLVC